jgi:MIP family channel proteins
LGAAVTHTGHPKGVRINPAETVAFWSVRRFPIRELLPYIAAQLVGAVAASATLRLVLGSVGALGARLPLAGVGRAFIVEWLLSFVLMVVIMAVATDDRVANGFAALAVGLTVGLCALMGGPLTGASMNPARSFGPGLVGGQWSGHWLYWLAPITAMIAAARAYESLRRAITPPSRQAALTAHAVAADAAR